MQKDSKYTAAMMYAQAWFTAAINEKCADAVFNETVALSDSFAENPALWKDLCRAVDDDKAAISIVEEITKKLKFTEISTRTLHLMAENKRIDLISLVTDAYKKLYYQHKGIVEVNVDTVIELTSTQRNNLKKILEEKLQAPVLFNFRIKPEILGGLAVSFNSFLIDDTLSKKIKDFKQLILTQELHSGD